MPFADAKYPHDQRLIAAAPELLSACIESLRLLSTMTSDDFRVGKDCTHRRLLLAVIGKATRGDA